MGVRVSVWNLKTRWCVNARHVKRSQNQKKFQEAVNNCAHTLVVLVLCIFGTCRAFLLAEVFLTRCPLVNFSCAPVFVCLKGPWAYVCAVSFDVIRCTHCSETVLRPSSWPQPQTSHRQMSIVVRWSRYRQYSSVHPWGCWEFRYFSSSCHLISMVPLLCFHAPLLASIAFQWSCCHWVSPCLLPLERFTHAR